MSDESPRSSSQKAEGENAKSEEPSADVRPSAIAALVKMNAKLEQVKSKVEEIPALKNLIEGFQGDSGSPVYCYVRGIKYLIGVMTDVGTYRELKRSANDEMRCEDYDFVVIADIRANMGEVNNIFLQRGLGDNLAKGQKICHKIDF
ncbi:unnamed protein product [Heligmosomoides polygyrus]|uniref:Chemotaxis protein CheW n=1 Tax=Heligmosomoides polygyrus TaxID=6339 RepID=A0A183G9I2_HELPZ|nr:unnamed protein product [Heligmosomoides polygyrus]